MRVSPGATPTLCTRIGGRGGGGLLAAVTPPRPEAAAIGVGGAQPDGLQQRPSAARLPAVSPLWEVLASDSTPPSQGGSAAASVLSDGRQGGQAAHRSVGAALAALAGRPAALVSPRAAAAEPTDLPAPGQQLQGVQAVSPRSPPCQLDLPPAQAAWRRSLLPAFVPPPPDSPSPSPPDVNPGGGSRGGGRFPGLASAPHAQDRLQQLVQAAAGTTVRAQGLQGPNAVANASASSGGRANAPSLQLPLASAGGTGGAGSLDGRGPGHSAVSMAGQRHGLVALEAPATQIGAHVQPAGGGLSPAGTQAPTLEPVVLGSGCGSCPAAATASLAAALAAAGTLGPAAGPGSATVQVAGGGLHTDELLLSAGPPQPLPLPGQGQVELPPPSPSPSPSRQQRPSQQQHDGLAQAASPSGDAGAWPSSLGPLPLTAGAGLVVPLPDVHAAPPPLARGAASLHAAAAGPGPGQPAAAPSAALTTSSEALPASASPHTVPDTARTVSATTAAGAAAGASSAGVAEGGFDSQQERASTVGAPDPGIQQARAAPTPAPAPAPATEPGAERRPAAPPAVAPTATAGDGAPHGSGSGGLSAQRAPAPDPAPAPAPVHSVLRPVQTSTSPAGGAPIGGGSSDWGGDVGEDDGSAGPRLLLRHEGLVALRPRARPPAPAALQRDEAWFAHGLLPIVHQVGWWGPCCSPGGGGGAA